MMKLYLHTDVSDMNLTIKERYAATLLCIYDNIRHLHLPRQDLNVVNSTA